MKYRILLYFFLLFWFGFTLSIFAQRNSKDDIEPYSLKRRAFAIGGNINTSGIGFDLYFAKRRNPNWEYTGWASITSIKNQRENRIDSELNLGGTPYIYDKLNYAYNLSLTVGMQKMIFEMDEFSRFSMHAGFSLGPNICLMKPYYLEIFVPIGPPVGGYVEGIAELATIDDESVLGTQITDHDIIGEASFFAGSGKMSAVPGFRCKFYVLMNLASSLLYIRGLNLGLNFDVFSKDLPIFYTHDNKQFYITGSIGILFGNAWE